MRNDIVIAMPSGERAMTDPSIQATPPPNPATPSDAPPSVMRPAGPVLPFTVTFVSIHTLLWCICFGLLLLYAPKAERTFRDFNMTLPALTIYTLAAARWVGNYWYILLIWLVLGLTVDIGLLVMLYPRRRALAWAWALLLLLLPLVVGLAIFVTLVIPMVKLLDGLSR
jgi:hypothetical protein